MSLATNRNGRRKNSCQNRRPSFKLTPPSKYRLLSTKTKYIMFRVRNYALSVRYILEHHQRINKYVASLHQHAPVLYKVQIRDPCPQKPPPPPPKPTDDSAFWGAMTVLFLAGGFAVIAKGSPEIRDWLTIHAPWFDDIIAIAYEENMTYEEFARKCVKDVKNCFNSIKNVEKPKECSLDVDDDDQIVEEKPIIPEPIHCEIEDRKGESIEPDTEQCEEPPPIVVTKTACEIIDRLNDRGNDALSNYYTATAACTFYNQLVDETMQDFTISKLKQLSTQMQERSELVCESIKNAEEATADIEDLVRYLECGATGTPEEIEGAKQLMNDYLQKITASCIQYQWENDKSVVMDAQWQKVKAVVDKYYAENESMFPDVKYEQNKLRFLGDKDLFLYHTSRYVQKLKNQLSELIVNMRERVDMAIDTLSQDDKEKKQRSAYMQSVLKEKRGQMTKEYQKRYDDQNKVNDYVLKESLKRQLERHQDTMEKRLAQKEKEVTAKLEILVAEKVAYEKSLLEKQKSEMAAKLKVVEDQLNARLKVESETKRSQELWAAGASLLAATKKGEPYIKVDRELKAIEKASGDGDKLVTTVLKAIPESVREKGVVPESVLREKYHMMESTALKVALVEQEGAPLPVYFMSWLQSMLLFMKLSGIPQQEIDTLPQEPFEDLDTFDLLQRARFWIERGNLAAAIRYVSSLEGASRAAAASWHDAAKSHLETKQAAEAILAHAASMGLQYI